MQNYFDLTPTLPTQWAPLMPCSAQCWDNLASRGDSRGKILFCFPGDVIMVHCQPLASDFLICPPKFYFKMYDFVFIVKWCFSRYMTYAGCRYGWLTS